MKKSTRAPRFHKSKMERENLLLKTANEIIIDDTNTTNINTIQEVIIDDSATNINSTDLLKSGSVCVIFSTHPASTASSQQQSQQQQQQSHTASHANEQPQQQPTQTISVNPVVRDISSSGSVMTG